ncbi:GNAT family N-acetyltransferase [Sphingomonas sp. R86521]|uniref:GNAT family N-acetyltransferase n=1 Tax=Sphingomonas sp. R86521 TaxID=3093860 RepID=UPI0036D2EFA7
MTPVVPLRFQVGARTLAAVPRRLVRMALSLDAVLAAAVPALPRLPDDADGFLVTSVPEAAIDGFVPAGLLCAVRQRYVRYHIDFGVGVEAWLAGLSGSARSGLKRKARKLAAASGGTLDIRAYRTVEEMRTFHPLARAVSATTYQERLLGAGLPEDVAYCVELAAEDRIRGWLLFVGDAPAAYLCCTAEGESLRYDHVGHDPAHDTLSPGAVLQMEAMRALFDDRFARFDFTEGEGQHKRQFATGGTACVDLLLLRPTLSNRAILAALGAFDGAVAWAKRASAHPALQPLAKQVRR